MAGEEEVAFCGKVNKNTQGAGLTALLKGFGFIKQPAPYRPAPVVAYFGAAGIYQPTNRGADAWRVVWDQEIFGRATHWMPLPSPPTEFTEAEQAGKTQQNEGVR